MIAVRVVRQQQDMMSFSVRVLILVAVFGLAGGCVGGAKTSGAIPGAIALPTGDGLSAFRVAPSIRPRQAAGVGEEGPVRRHTFIGEGGDHNVDVSPDGRWLLFSSTRHAVEPELYLKRIGAATTVQVTDTPTEGELTPRFSLDGRRIALASDRQGNWDLYIFQRGRSRILHPLTETRATDEIAPAWHPQRPETIAYCARDRRRGVWEIRVMETNRPGFTTVCRGLFPRWSPRGDKLVFQRARTRGRRLYSIWTVDVRIDQDGNVQVGNTTEIAGSADWAAINPVFSPDGVYVAFATVARSPASRGPQQFWRGDDIWLVRLDGTGMRRLTTNPAPDYEPLWARSLAPGASTQNGRIYFISERTGHKNIWSLDPAAVIGRSSATSVAPMSRPKSGPFTAPMPSATPAFPTRPARSENQR